VIENRVHIRGIKGGRVIDQSLVAEALIVIDLHASVYIDGGVRVATEGITRLFLNIEDLTSLITELERLREECLTDSGDAPTQGPS
jgi:hypothetical protein